MEYTQERIATLHDLTGHLPDAPTDSAAIVIPMTERDHATLASERLFSVLETVDPAAVFVALRASPANVREIGTWLDDFDLPVETLWCNAESTRALLAAHGIDGPGGKGQDIWLGLGVAAAEQQYVLAHDADSRTATPEDIYRLLFPLERNYSFVKGYYARVENGRLYGRLNRLFFTPLQRVLLDSCDAPICPYLGAYRYPLAGEFAASSAFIDVCRPEPGFGFEVGLLGDAFTHAEFAGSAQVDLGRYQHDHRAVSGPTGLADMSRDVCGALLRVLDDNGVGFDLEYLRSRYREVAKELIRQYELDAAFNGLSFDPQAEHEQVDAYAAAIEAPGGDERLPSWNETTLEPSTVFETARTALEDA